MTTNPAKRRGGRAVLTRPMIGVLIVAVFSPITGLVITVLHMLPALKKNQAGLMSGSEYSDTVSSALRFTAYGLLLSVVSLLVLWGLYEHAKWKRKRR